MKPYRHPDPAVEAHINAQLAQEEAGKLAKREARKSRRQESKNDYRREWRWRKAGHPGATVERYEALFAAQGGRCALCANPPGRKALVYDERGLLCTGCHVHMAWVERNQAEVAQYLGVSLDNTTSPMVDLSSLTD